MSGSESPWNPVADRFTKGKWEAVQRYSNGCAVCPEVWAGKRHVATFVGSSSLGCEESLPNAVLSAAAPDMLTMLRRLHGLMTRLPDGEIHAIFLARAEVMELEKLIDELGGPR